MMMKNYYNAIMNQRHKLKLKKKKKILKTGVVFFFFFHFFHTSLHRLHSLQKHFPILFHDNFNGEKVILPGIPNG